MPELTLCELDTEVLAAVGPGGGMFREGEDGPKEGLEVVVAGDGQGLLLMLFVFSRRSPPHPITLMVPLSPIRPITCHVIGCAGVFSRTKAILNSIPANNMIDYSNCLYMSDRAALVAP